MPFWLKPFCSSRRCSRASTGSSFPFALWKDVVSCRAEVGLQLPASQQWPSAKANRQQSEQCLGRLASVPERPGRWRQDRQFVGQPSQPRPRLSPEESRADASTKVARLQAALLTLGPEDLVEKAALEASLQKAQVQATVPPVAEQVKQTTQFIERAKKRLSSASEWVQWAQDWRSQRSKELAEAEERLVRLQAEEVHPMEEVVGKDWETEAKALRQQIVELECRRQSSVFTRVAAAHPVQSSVEAVQVVQERATKRRACGKEVPSSPELISEWLCAKHLELRDALEMGDTLIVAELTQLWAAGGAKMQAMSAT